MLEILAKQFFHRFLKFQGTILEEENANTTSIESYSNQRCNQPLLKAVSIANITPTNFLATSFHVK
jgi:hypothetical protein